MIIQIVTNYGTAGSSSMMAYKASLLQTGFFGISIGEAEVGASESESVRQARDEKERQKREQSEREEILRDEQNEILFAIQKVQNSVDVLPKTMSNDELSKQVPQSFQKVFDLIDDLKGSRFVDEAGEDDNLVITETSPSPKIDVVSKPQQPPPPPNTTIPPIECEIHESPQFFYDGI
ncbi:unnamed protein product [Lactuca virosa]|uniref:Uncharacterized protein n=1 Tax=Lactuca virosa TaxID=75947 RepID=A0AAU9P7W9_9ASTR|nr:unnamed protein product [Lactuca virosa]